ncbi:MAG: hypothetical protein ACE5QW_06770 [Thermoplasmata archaeon]
MHHDEPFDNGPRSKTVVPTNTSIRLAAGWNLVGFPSFLSSFTVADLKAILAVERVEGSNTSAPLYLLSVLHDFHVLLAGGGYLVKDAEDASWIVSDT